MFKSLKPILLAVPRKKIFQVFALLLLCGIMAKDLINYNKTIKNFKFHVPFINAIKSDAKDENFKHILFWMSLKDSTYWNMGGKIHNEEFLKSIDCPVTNCIFSHDRKLLPQETDYDAIVFHVGNFIAIDSLPSARTKDQIYIMASDE